MSLCAMGDVAFALLARGRKNEKNHFKKRTRRRREASLSDFNFIFSRATYKPSGYPRYGCAPRFKSAMRNVALVVSYMAADPFLESARPGPASSRGGAGLPMPETARRLRPARMGVDVNEDHLAVVII